jgi:hypothetical protein
MGMFDELHCEFPLPDAAVQDEVFQTKSFERLLDRYTITGDGRLILHQVRYEEVPEEERPYYGTPEWEQGGLFRLCGSMRAVPVGDVEVLFHGDIVFYTSLEDRPGRQWFEYRARFTDGRLQWIRRVEKQGKNRS